MTCNTLELIRIGLPPIIWPLRSLRKYGHDDDIFTFESGRRGPQGAGVYSFRCTRAKQLFELVQKTVHKSQEEQANSGSTAGSRRISLGTIIDSPMPNVPPNSLILPGPQASLVASQADLQSSLPTSPKPTNLVTTPNSMTTEFTNAQYMNVVLPQSQQSPNLNLNNYEQLMQGVVESEEYQNVHAGNLIEDPKGSYTILEFSSQNSQQQAIQQPMNSELNFNETNNNESESEILTPSESAQVLMTTSNSGSYALINLDMTQALSALNAGHLSSSATPGPVSHDEGIRRTRHNSTLDGISSFGKLLG